MSRNELSRAKELLLEVQSSPEDILQFCPDLIEGTCMEGIARGAIGQFRIELFESKDPVVVSKRNNFLIGYLEDMRRSSADDFSEV